MNIPDCPLPTQPTDCITLAHGGGGRMTNRLIESIFYPAFANQWLEQAHDGATLPMPHSRLAFTTDSFVVSPLFFPRRQHRRPGRERYRERHAVLRGDTALPLGRLHSGRGATPRHPAASGAGHARGPASRAGVSIVTGDTKVVEHGKCDGLYINTSGIGLVPGNIEIGLHRVQKGGRRNRDRPDRQPRRVNTLHPRGAEFRDNHRERHCRPDPHRIEPAGRCPPTCTCCADPTRGGLSSTLNEIAEGAGVTITLDEQSLPIEPPVRAACDLLGLDPLYVANEGILLIFLPDEHAEQALHIIRNDPHGKGARLIGHVTDDRRPEVLLELALGQTSVLDMLSGEQLPRIC